MRPASRVLPLVLLAGLSATVACVDLITDTEAARSPRGIQLNIGQVEVLAGDTVQIVAAVTDQHGQFFANLPAGLTIVWSVSDTSVLRIEVAGDGREATAFALRRGDVSVTAALGVLAANGQVHVRGAPTLLLPTEGDEQEVVVGRVAPDSIRVRALDKDGEPVPGIRVLFQAEEGHGEVSPDTVVTDEGGFAAAQWLLGTTAGPQRAEARFRELEAGFTANTLPDAPAVILLSHAELAFDALGDTARLDAAAEDQYGNAIPDLVVDWASSDTTIVQVDATGLVESRSRGTASVLAALNSIEAGVQVFVDPDVHTIEVSPGEALLTAIEDTVRLEARAFDRNENALDDVTFQWTSTDAAIVEVDSTGLATSRGGGTAGVSASAQGRADTATVVVAQEPDAVAIHSPIDTLNALSHTRTLLADVLDRNGFPIAGAAVAWTSLDPGIVTVDAAGTVQAQSPGTGRVVAEVESGAADTALVTVRQVVASVAVSPSTLALDVGATGQLSAAAADSAGFGVVEVEFVWGTFDPGVATVDDNGLVTGIAPGETVIQAVADGVGGQAEVVVGGEVGDPGELESVSAGEAHTCAVTTTGDLYCWGSNDYGQLGTGGLGLAASSAEPIRVSSVGAPFESVSAGHRFTCALTAAGDLYCWGHDANGELGSGRIANEACGGGWTDCATEPLLVAGGHRWTAVAAGRYHACGITEDGAAYCWGRGTDAQLGTGSFGSSDTPVPVVGGRVWAQLSAGESHTCGITVDGDAFCWGYNSSGQLGSDSHPPGTEAAWATSPEPVVGGRTWLDLSAGYVHTCGVEQGGDLFCWGAYTDWDDQAVLPEQVAGVSSVVRVAAGTFFTCAATTDGVAYCLGSNQYGQLGDGTTSLFPRASPAQVAGGLAFSSLAAGDQHACGVTANGQAYCWGHESEGRLGNGDMGFTAVPVSAGIVLDAVTTSAGTTCGVRFDGAAFCWGNNAGGQTGDGTTEHPRFSPVAVVGGIEFMQISRGGIHTCGVAMDGTGYCWGTNSFGELGTGDFQPRMTPTAVIGGHQWRALETHVFRTCGVTVSGQAYCWGSGVQGDGTDPSWTPTPRLVAGGHTFDRIGVGSFTCALTTSDEAYCWGHNPDGAFRLLPEPVDGGLQFAHVRVGVQFACGVGKDDQLVRCWGINGFGQLGDGTTSTARWTPAPVAGLGPVLDQDVALPMDVGWDYACAIDMGLMAHCWGGNRSGKLGSEWQELCDPDLEHPCRTSPTPVQGSIQFTSIATGTTATCATDWEGDGRVYCWGSKEYGQLGDGSFHGRLVPVPVIGVQGFRP